MIKPERLPIQCSWCKGSGINAEPGSQCPLCEGWGSLTFPIVPTGLKHGLRLCGSCTRHWSHVRKGLELICCWCGTATSLSDSGGPFDDGMDTCFRCLERGHLDKLGYCTDCREHYL